MNRIPLVKRFERLYCGKYWCLEPSRWTFWHCYETYQFSSSYLKSHGTQKHYLTYLEYTTCPLYRMKCNHKCWATIIGWAHMQACTEWIIKIYHFYKCIILLYWILGRIALILTIQICKNDLFTIIISFHNNNLLKMYVYICDTYNIPIHWRFTCERYTNIGMREHMQEFHLQKDTTDMRNEWYKLLLPRSVFFLSFTFRRRLLLKQ